MPKVHLQSHGTCSLQPSLSPFATLDRVTKDPTSEDLEQLARSVAMSGVFGDRDRLDVVVALRRLAEIDKAKRLVPVGPSSWSHVGHRIVTTGRYSTT